LEPEMLESQSKPQTTPILI